MGVRLMRHDTGDTESFHYATIVGQNRNESLISCVILL